MAIANERTAGRRRRGSGRARVGEGQLSGRSGRFGGWGSGLRRRRTHREGRIVGKSDDNPPFRCSVDGRKLNSLQKGREVSLRRGSVASPESRRRASVSPPAPAFSVNGKPSADPAPPSPTASFLKLFLKSAETDRFWGRESRRGSFFNSAPPRSSKPNRVT